MIAQKESRTMPVARKACYFILGLVGLTLFGLSSVNAMGAPSLELDVTHSPESIPRNDEQATFSIIATNNAPAVVGAPSVGNTLGCNGAKPNKAWTPGTLANRPSGFSFEWRRNGQVIAGQASATYTAVGADSGKVIQCVVIGKSANGLSAAAYASLPGVVVDPQPATAPPIPVSPSVAASRPTITGAGTRVCAAPSNWEGAPTFEFQWLRNGARIDGANLSEYTPVAADSGTRLQCEVIGANAGGSLVGISEGVSIDTVTAPPVLAVANTPSIIVDAANPTIEIELPPKAIVQQLGFVNPSNPSRVTAANLYWRCPIQPENGSQPATIKCTNPNVLSPSAPVGGALPASDSLALNLVVGSEVASPVKIKVTASGGGIETPMVVEDELPFGPPVPLGVSAFTTKVADALGNDYTRAGGHPTSANATFELPTRVLGNGEIVGVEAVRSVVTDLPPGFIGNPQAAPQTCTSIEAVMADTLANPTCPPASIVGSVDLLAQIIVGPEYQGAALYSLRPEPGAPAQFAFVVKNPTGFHTPITLTPRLRPGDGYAITVDAPQIAKNVVPRKIGVTLCGFGAKLQEEPLGFFVGAPQVAGCRAAGEPGANEVPFTTNPTECAATPPITKVAIDSWEHPGAFVAAEDEAPAVTDCDEVPFNPTVQLQPTSSRADSPTGLNVSISMPTDGLETASGVSQGHLKRAIVTLPKGMAVNPSAAAGLGACTSAQLALGTNDPITCPNSSKVGGAVVKTPLLDEELKGGVYLAKQGDNPFKSLLALYLVVESKERGIIAKIPGKVQPQADGQLVATFDDNPQVPFSSLELQFNSGGRAALLNPPKCGTYSIVSEVSPWSAADADNPTPAETRTAVSTFVINEGPGGGPCPTGNLEPRFNAGSMNPVAATTSPFVLTLSRDDGSQRFAAVDMSLPRGLTAYLKGVPYCPDAALASVSGAEGTGASELATPACPAASRIGTVSVAAGGGANPFEVATGKAYLAGPYKGAPLSIAIVTPAVAGPFDLGSVVVRSAAFVDPATAQITVKSDPIPTILHGIPLDVREVRVNVDRPGFMLAPTNCEEMAVSGLVGGADGARALVSNRFQVTNCARLGFTPKLTLHYKGQTKRTGNPALRAVLTQPAGQANIANTQVILPKGSFIDNAHINNPCTRAQYAANACPAKSILGKATAWSPLLDEPLSGNVYFRSNGGERELPDIVAKLQGQVEVELVGYVDSVVNKKTGSSRVRNTFAIVPDAPVSRFVLTMKGGKLGLIENSKNLCKQKNRATVKMNAHNGLALTTEPVVKTSCGKKAKKRKK